MEHGPDPSTDDPGEVARDARRVLLIVNDHARRGTGAKEQAAKALTDAGLTVVSRDCRKAGDIAALIKAEASGVDAAVIGGGDGTLNAAAPALRDTGLPLGILPLGTANDLARTLGIPTDPVEAAAIVARGKTHAIDLGLANDHPFFNVASIGMGVDLARALTRDAKSRWGALGYAVAGLRVLRRMRPFRAEIIEDGGKSTTTRTVHLAVGNGRHYGGGMTVSESAAIDDRRLNIYSLEVGSIWKLLLILPAMRAGTHGRWEEVRTLAGADITVRTRHPRSVNTDGEITTRTPVRFTVLPGAIKVFVP